VSGLGSDGRRQHLESDAALEIRVGGLVHRAARRYADGATEGLTPDRAPGCILGGRTVGSAMDTLHDDGESGVARGELVSRR
jgi:hypothetical protein